MLNPLADIAQAHERIVCVWLTDNGLTQTGSALARAVQNAVNANADVTLFSVPQSFVGHGGIWCGAALSINASGDGKTYDSIFSNGLSGFRFDAGLNGGVLAFVDYGQPGDTGAQEAAAIANLDNGQNYYLNATDAVGAQTIYLQRAYNIQIAKQNAENTTVGYTALVGEKAGSIVQSASAGIATAVLAAAVLLVAVDKFVLKEV